MLLGMDITVKDADIVNVMKDLYAKTPEALERLLGELRKIGYEIENLREAKSRKLNCVTVEQMEQNGYSMWFATIPNLNRGKCDSCNEIIDINGIQSHGHTCEKCGAVTYYEIVDGSILRFEFNRRDHQGTIFSPQLVMKAKRWDIKKGYLYLYLDFIKSGGFSVVTGKKAEEYLNQNQKMWEIVKEDDCQLLKLKYPLQWSSTESAINPIEIYFHYINHHIVRIWNGIEYGEWDKIPVSEMISIYESWHWSPIEKSPTIHAKIMSACGQVSDKGYYYQDGSTAIYESVRDDMANYIRHFTTLDADAFLQNWNRFRKSGPGFIDDFSRWCHETPLVEDRPNIMNTINAVFNIKEGKPISNREFEAAINGVKDPLSDNFKNMFVKISSRKKNEE